MAKPLSTRDEVTILFGVGAGVGAGGGSGAFTATTSPVPFVFGSPLSCPVPDPEGSLTTGPTTVPVCAGGIGEAIAEVLSGGFRGLSVRSMSTGRMDLGPSAAPADGLLRRTLAGSGTDLSGCGGTKLINSNSVLGSLRCAS